MIATESDLARNGWTDAQRLLFERFACVTPELRNEGPATIAGWGADCPACSPELDPTPRIFIDRSLRILPCAHGHDAAAVMAEVDAFRRMEPGCDDGEPEAVALPAKTGWAFTSAREFLAREFPPQRWLYMDLVPAESVTVVMAAPNAGKTFFGLDVVCQVAAKAAARGVHVCIVEEEGTGAAFQWRLSRALASVGGANPDLIRVTWNTGRSLLHPPDLASLAKDCEGAELIMLDSLSALSGGIDENKSEDMSRIAEALHALKTQTLAAILLLHHMTKAAWKEGETPRLEHMRGHGALPGRADAVLALVPLESDEEAVNFELHCVKQRDGSKPHARSFSVAMRGPAATITIDLAAEREPAKARTGRPAGGMDVVMESLMENAKVPESEFSAMAAGTIAKLISRNRDNVLKACKMLSDNGIFGRVDGGSYPLFWRVRRAP